MRAIPAVDDVCMPVYTLGNLMPKLAASAYAQQFALARDIERAFGRVMQSLR